VAATMPRPPLHPGIGLWFVLCVIALGVFVLNPSEPEAAVAFGIAMLLLTFPSGLAVVVPVAILSALLEGSAIPTLMGALGPAPMVILWLAMVTVGYFQWRVWVPWLIRKLQTHTQP
jgi:zinc transporter ZupT